MLSLLSFLLSALLVLAGFTFLWPLVAHWQKRNDLLVALTAFGLSTGLLTQWMLALAALHTLTLWPVLGLVAMGWAAGYWRNPDWFRLAWARAALRDGRATLAGLGLPTLLLSVMAASLGVVLVYNLYYPFMGADTLARYALQARLVYEGRSLPAEVRGFPLLVPLGFAYTWLLSGQVNEHLANLIPFAFGSGMLGVTVLLGRRLPGIESRLNALLAGAILASSPLFVNWAASGYTDLPTGFYVGLAALFAIRWCEKGKQGNALLAGILVGLAAWTKQSALLMLASLAAVATLRGLMVRRAWVGIKGAALMIAPVLVIAGPWYVRNYILDGGGGVVVLPGAYHLLGVRPQVAGVLPSRQFPSDFGFALAPLYAAGILLALWRGLSGGWAALCGRAAWPVADLVGLALVLPYWLAWWTRFSFDPRFLLVVMPLYAAWAAWPLAWLVRRREWTKHWAWLAVPLAGAVLAMGVFDRVGAASFAVTQPFASDEDKLLRTREDLYPTVLWFRENLEPGDRVISMDGRLPYYLTPYDIEVAYPLNFEQIARYDYVVDFSATTSIYPALGWTDSDYWQHRRDSLYFEEVFDGGAGSEIFRVLPAVRDAS